MGEITLEQAWEEYQAALAKVVENERILAEKMAEVGEMIRNLESAIGITFGCTDLIRQAAEGAGRKATGGEDGELGNVR